MPRQQRQENKGLTAILSYLVSWGPDWNTPDLASKIKGEGDRLESAQWVEMPVTKYDKLKVNSIPGAVHTEREDQLPQLSCGRHRKCCGVFTETHTNKQI